MAEQFTVIVFDGGRRKVHDRDHWNRIACYWRGKKLVSIKRIDPRDHDEVEGSVTIPILSTFWNSLLKQHKLQLRKRKPADEQNPAQQRSIERYRLRVRAKPLLEEGKTTDEVAVILGVSKPVLDDALLLRTEATHAAP